MGLSNREPESTAKRQKKCLENSTKERHANQQTDYLHEEEDFFGMGFAATELLKAKVKIHNSVTVIHNMRKIIKKYATILFCS